MRAARQAARVTNRLYYGDNLGIFCAHLADKSVDQGKLDL
jgi:hypothetical protein